MSLVGVDFSDGVASVGRIQTSAALKREPDLAGIFSTHAPSAEAVAEALNKAGLNGKVKTVTFDATPEAIQMLKDGSVDLVIAQKPAEMGYYAVLMGAAHAAGYTDIPKRITTGYVVIDKDNMDDPDVARWFYSDSAE